MAAGRPGCETRDACLLGCGTHDASDMGRQRAPARSLGGTGGYTMSTGHWRTPRSRLTAFLLGIGLAITCTTQLFVPAQGAAPAARVSGLVAPGPVTGVTVTATTTSSITLSWTNPTSANFTGVMIRRATGSTPPATPASGTLVIDKAKPATSHANTGLAAGTQYSYALFAHDAVPSYAAAATTTATTKAATTSDWSQARHDSGHRGWSATENLISPLNVRNVVEEWTAAGGAPAIAGNLVYVISTEPLGSTGVLTAYNLTTGVVTWQISTGTCTAGPVSVTATLVIVAMRRTATRLRAWRRPWPGLGHHRYRPGPDPAEPPRPWQHDGGLEPGPRGGVPAQ